MKILSIGNSFSMDAQRYLHQLARKEGVDLYCMNLYIGGCPQRTHYLNLLDDVASYDLQVNGTHTNVKISIRQALRSENWDVVTFQQASGQSARFETYTPYLQELSAYVRKYCPHAKQVIHQTWAYENGCAKLESLQFASSADMFAPIEKAYKQAAELIGADGIIPAGKAMLIASQAGIEKIHRDTYHASLGAGRYLLALVWFKYLTGRDISENDFNDFDTPVTEEERKIVIAAANAAFA